MVHIAPLFGYDNKLYINYGEACQSIGIERGEFEVVVNVYRNLLGSEDEPDPDNTIKGSRHEQAVVSAIAGVTTPLGTGPTYPNPKRKKRKNRKK